MGQGVRVRVVEEAGALANGRKVEVERYQDGEQKGHTTKAGCTICTTTLESLTSSAKALVQVANPPLLIE